MPPLPTPGWIAKHAKELGDAVGIEAVVKYLGRNRWRISLDNERTHMHVDYRVQGRRFEWDGSTLTIDGKPAPLADSPEELALRFNEPDTSISELHADVVIPPAANIEDAPPIVAHTLRKNAAILKARNIKAHSQLSRSGMAAWVVGFYTDTSLIEIIIARKGNRWAVDELIRFVYQNREVKGVKTLRQVLAVFAEGTPRDGVSKGVRQADDVKRSPTSVEVRNSKVIRN